MINNQSNGLQLFDDDDFVIAQAKRWGVYEGLKSESKRLRKGVLLGNIIHQTVLGEDGTATFILFSGMADPKSNGWLMFFIDASIVQDEQQRVEWLKELVAASTQPNRN